MGHKQIVLIFNVILLVFFLFVFLLPVGVLGWDWTLGYWSRQWYWLVILTFLIGLSWLLFYFKFRFHDYIAREDWKGLLGHLEKRQKTGKRLNSTEVRLWVIAGFLSREVQKVIELDQLLRLKQPSLWLREGLLFTLPLWLRHEDDELEKRLKYLLQERRKVRHWRWAQWCLALRISLGERTSEARALLEPLLEKRTLVGLLSAFLLSRQGHAWSRIDEIRRRWAKVGTERLASQWKKNKEEIVFTLFLDGVFENCLQWLQQSNATGGESFDGR